MIPSKSLLALSLGIASVAGVSMLDSSPTQPAQPLPDRTTWEVSVTNLTRGQIFSPPVVATHNSRMMPLWGLGYPASKELAALAEDAQTAGLIARLQADRNVASVSMIKGKNGVILPGETAKIRIDGGSGRGGRFDRISMAGMLVITNDAFFGLDRVLAPHHGTKAVRSAAYDAGSEANNEDCRFIPGPPCGNGGVRATKDAEGYVHIHAGIHGIKDLSAAKFDWRSDVALIRIRRVR
jgi:hypothetical protein